MLTLYAARALAGIITGWIHQRQMRDYWWCRGLNEEDLGRNEEQRSAPDTPTYTCFRGLVDIYCFQIIHG